MSRGRGISILLVLGLGVLGWGLWEYRRVENRTRHAEDRIEDLLPQGEGIAAVEPLADETPSVTVLLAPKDGADTPERWFSLRVGERTWEVPYHPEDADADALADWQAALAPTWEEIERALVLAREGFEDPAQVVGGIRVATSGFRVVPPDLVILVLDLLLRSGFAEVSFEGSPSPVSEAEADGEGR